jgi:hypothetical protein
MSSSNNASDDSFASAVSFASASADSSASAASSASANPVKKFHSQEEEEEEQLANMKKSKYKIVNIGYTLDSLNPNSIKRNIFMIKYLEKEFPTLIKDANKEWFPFYVSSGTNFSASQKDKLTCYAGHTLNYPQSVKTYIKDLYKNKIEYYRNESGVTDITKDLFSFFLNYCNNYKKKKEIIDIENFIDKIVILGNWFIKFNPSTKINTSGEIEKRSGLYDPNFTNYNVPSKEDIFTFLGGKGEEITEAIKRTTSGEGQDQKVIKDLEKIYCEILW